MGKVQRKRKNRAYVQELLGRIGNGFLENGNEEHTNEFSFQANDGETETENWDPTEYEVQSDEHAEYLQTEEPLFEDEKDPRDIERIAALLHVTQLLYPLNLSPQKLCMVFECAKYIVQFGLNSKEISDSAESLYNEFCDPKTNTYCSLCYNELVGGVCEKKECILFRKKTVRGSSSETTIVTSYQIRQQVTKVLSRQLPEVLETHRFHHNLNQNHLTYTDLSSFHISMKYGANIERFQDFNQKRLILPVSISHDGFRPTNHSKSELTPLYLRIEGVKKQVKEAADSIILCAIMSGPKGVCKGNAGLFAARLCNELEDIRNDNIRLSIDGEVWNVQLQVTMTILDLKASHCSSGWPNWLNIRGCSYCKIKGKKEGRGAVSFYSESRQQPRTRNELVEDMRNTSFINNLTILASPYDNSIDELHVCSEGIFKRILTDMLGITSHSPALKLSKAQIAGIDKCVSNLRSHTDYRSNFVTFSKLGKLSGTQIRQLSRVVFALGAHANLYGSLEVRLLLVSLLQLFDLSMSIKNAADLPKLNYIAHMVKYFLYKKDPMDFSLKTHIFVDHVEQKISEDGNLSGTSTAPFEKNHRLLSINYDQHSTSMADLGRRFLAAQALRDHNIKASEGEIRLNSTVSVRSNYLIVCEETVRQLKTMIPAHRCPDKFWKRVIMADGQVLSSKQWRRKNSIEELSVSMSSPSGFVYGYPLAFFEENSEMFVLMKKFTVQDPTVELLSEASRHVFQKDLVDGFAHLTTTTSCLLIVGESNFFICPVSKFENRFIVLEFRNKKYLLQAHN